MKWLVSEHSSHSITTSCNNLICFCIDPIMSVWFTRDGQGLLVSCLDSSIRLIDKDTGELLQEYTAFFFLLHFMTRNLQFPM